MISFIVTLWATGVTEKALRRVTDRTSTLYPWAWDELNVRPLAYQATPSRLWASAAVEFPVTPCGARRWRRCASQSSVTVTLLDASTLWQGQPLAPPARRHPRTSSRNAPTEVGAFCAGSPAALVAGGRFV
jgi:hypothetical protein